MLMGTTRCEVERADGPATYRTSCPKRATFPGLEREQCIALTTFRKSGQRVVTPVWFAERLGAIYVAVHADTGKLKRLRRSGRVTLAPCTCSGKVTAAVSAGKARILTEPLECTAASTALAKKYCFMRPLVYFVMNAEPPASTEGASRERLHRDRAHFRLNLVCRTTMRMVKNGRREEYASDYKRTTTRIASITYPAG